MELLLKIVKSVEFLSTLAAAFVVGVVKIAYDRRLELILFVKKIRLIIFPIKFNIAFVFTSEGSESLDVYSKEVKKQFNTQINQNNVLDPFL